MLDDGAARSEPRQALTKLTAQPFPTHWMWLNFGLPLVWGTTNIYRPFFDRPGIRNFPKLLAYQKKVYIYFLRMKKLTVVASHFFGLLWIINLRFYKL
jgi:hypothetical protein